jgi:gas vesicle protein
MAEEQHGNNMKKIAGIAAISAAAGAAAAAMFTPKSGRELRNKLRGKAREIGGKAKSKLENHTD